MLDKARSVTTGIQFIEDYMCCDNCGDDGEANGECPECGEPTVDGFTKDCCNYSPICCKECQWTPCDGSC